MDGPKFVSRKWAKLPWRGPEDSPEQLATIAEWPNPNHPSYFQGIESGNAYRLDRTYGTYEWWVLELR